MAKRGLCTENMSWTSKLKDNACATGDIIDEIILGLDFLRQHNISLDFGVSVLRIRDEEIVTSVPQNTSTICKVVRTEDVQLSGHAENGTHCTHCGRKRR